MLIRKLIEMLEEEYKRQLPLADILGQPSIELDIFKLVDKEKGLFEYNGLLTLEDFHIDTSSDGVYRVISAFDESYESTRTC